MVPEERRTCPACGSPVGRSRDGQPGRTEGSARTAAPVLVHPQAQRRRPRRRPVRGRRGHRPRRPRLDLRRARPQRLRPLGRAQGSAQLRRPRRAGRGDRRAAVPRPGRAPAHRRDLQLRDPRGRRLHRHGVRRRHLAQAAAQGADEGGRRHVRPAPGRPGDRLHRRDPAGVPVPARPQPVYCDFKPDNIIQVGRRGQADRPRRGAPARRPRLRDLRDGGLPGAGGRRGRAVGGLRHLHDRAHADRARDGVPRLPVHLRRLACRRSTRRRCSRSTTRSTGCCSRPAPPTPPTGSSPPTSCASSCSACSARSSAARARRRSRALHVARCCSTSRGLDDALDWQDLPAPARRRRAIRRPPGCAR